DRERDFTAVGKPGERSLHLVLVPVQVPGRVRCDLQGLTHGEQVPGLLADPDGLVGPDLDGGDVDALAVDLDVAVRDELAALAHGEREPEPQDDRVGPGLELSEQLLAGDADASLGPLEVPAELALADPVDGPELLL